MNAISKKSMKNPRIKTTTLTTRRKPSAPPGIPVSIVSIHISPSNPRKTSANAVEPIRRKTTMMVKRLVSSIALSRASNERDRFIRASTMAPTDPSAPASVGVATPAKMLPSTTTIRAKGGTSETMTRFNSSTPSILISSGSAGATSGLANAIIAMYSAYAPVRASPGSNAALKSDPTGTPIWSPRTIRTIEGGMICPSVPAAAITPRLISSL